MLWVRFGLGRSRSEGGSLVFFRFVVCIMYDAEGVRCEMDGRDYVLLLHCALTVTDQASLTAAIPTIYSGFSDLGIIFAALQLS